MKVKQIIFPEINKAALIDADVPAVGDNAVCVKTCFSTLSAGTERALITGDPNVAGSMPASVYFPRFAGYSSSGIVTEVGKNVKGLVPGDRVAMYSSYHKEYNVLPEAQVVKIMDGVSMEDAAVSYVSTFPMAAIRKTHLELGESALVMGLGLLGQIAVRLLRLAGATPIVAVDFVKERREEALAAGADYAFDPSEPDFAKKVKEVTEGGAKVCIEVTGVGQALDSALDCMAHFGRVALLGCTRDKNFTIDYYRKVHFPGITLVGAHTNARPQHESYPGYFTHVDDMRASMRLCASGRYSLSAMVKEIHAPTECETVYDRLIKDRNFPTLVLFDWSKM